MALTVVQLLPALDVGGVERGTLEVAKELVSRGHRAVVVSAGGQLAGDLRALGAEHVQWPIGRKSLLSLRYIRPLRHLLAGIDADIVHARSRLPAWLGFLAWRGMNPARRPRFVTTVHGPYSVNRYSAIMVRGERIIAISEWIRQYVLDNYPQVDQERITVIPRGVDRSDCVYGYQPDAAWRNAFFETFPNAAGRRLLTLPARLSRRKGQTDFLKLIAALLAASVPVHGLIVGGAGARRQGFADELMTLSRTLGIEQHLSFTGSRRDVREIMAVSDIVLNLSLEPEGFGRTTVEALSLGRPVIGYRHSGIAEVLGRVYPLGLVATGNLSELAEKVIGFLQGVPPVPAHHPYTLQAMVDSTISLYQSLAGNE